MPRLVTAGPISLDLFHRDGRIGDRWIGLHPREFEVLWRLVETPRRIVHRTELLKDVWRLDYEPETNRVEVNISRIRSKLHVFRLSWLVRTGPRGGYVFDADSGAERVADIPMSENDKDDTEPLDGYLHSTDQSSR